MNPSTIKNEEWRKVISHILEKRLEEVKKIEMTLEQNNYYPSQEKIFEAFNYFSPEETKVVLLGMDPYIGENQAVGLSFSVPKESKIPPSLKNIYKELVDDVGISKPLHGDLTRWVTEEKILLLNTALTVEKGKSGSHMAMWENITDDIIKYLSDTNQNTVFILLGNHAKKKESIINSKDRIIIAVHPSPLSAQRGFFGSKIFSRCNKLLREPINWKI